MFKKTFTTALLLAAAGCQQQEPAASPPVAGSEPTPTGEAQPASAPAAAPVAALPPATPDERAKLFQTCWGLFNAKDWSKFSNCYSENATAEQVDMGFAAIAGRNDVIEKNAKPFAGAFPDGVGELQLTLVNGNNIASVVLFRGTHSGPLVGPTGTLPPTNKKVGFLVGQSVELTEDGRAALHERLYYDAGSMLGQLGVNPAPHRKLIEVSAAEKPIVLATNSDVEKANLAAAPKGIEAFNKHDLNAILAMWADDGVFSDSAAPADTVGKAAMKKSYTDLFKAFPDVKLEVSKSWAAGDYVVMEGTFSGTNTGDMPSWKLKKTGKKVSQRYLEVAKIQNGKLKNSWIFDNGMAMAMQLGLVPPPGAKTAPAAKDSKAPAGAPAAAPATKDPKAAPAAPAGKESKAATPATPATPAVPGAKPATPATPATPAKDAKAATPAAPAAPAPTAAKPATPAAPAAPAAKPATPAAPAAPAPAAPPAKK
jgi:steroid delta-isomerase-like uncharacterized protein